MDVDRTVVELYKFLKKHASIPFKLEKPATPEPVISTKKAGEKIEGDSGKDELWWSLQRTECVTGYI